MTAGCELKANCFSPMENSFTRADAAARFFSSNSEICSRFSTQVNLKSEIGNRKWKAVESVPGKCSRLTHYAMSDSATSFASVHLDELLVAME